MTWAMKPELPTAVPAVSAPCRVPARESRHKPARGAADSLSPHRQPSARALMRGSPSRASRARPSRRICENELPVGTKCQL